MTLNISISTAAESRLRERAAATGQPVEAVVARIIEDAVQRTNGTALSGAGGLTRAESDRRLATIGQWEQLRRPAGHPVDDSRESIYRGRGQ